MPEPTVVTVPVEVVLSPQLIRAVNWLALLVESVS
jgi:hypothetical protein